MASDRIWKLTIEKSNGVCLSVHGTEEVLRPEVDAWVGFETEHADKAQEANDRGDEYGECESMKPRLIHGMSDTADRTQTLVAYRFADVIGMVLSEI